MARKPGVGGWLIAGGGVGVAVGVALGTLVLAPNMSDGGGVSLSSNRDELAAAEEQANIAESQAASADSVIEELVTGTVRGTLDDRPVLVMRTADADAGDVEGVETLLEASGAIDAGTITLTQKFFSREGADQLKSIVTNTLPAGAELSVDRLDPGVHAGEALGSALLLNPDNGEEQASSEDRALLLSTLRDAGYVEFESGTILPGQVVVIITGDSDGEGDAAFAAQNLADFSEALDSRGNGVVLAGRIRTAASESGAIAKVRANWTGVSTVDSVDRSWGQLATVLAVRDQLAGEAGAYGSAASADAAIPAP